MALLKPIETLESCLSNIPISSGQIIFCTDSRNIYIDNHKNNRIHMTDIIKLKKESDRTSISKPSTGSIYLVEENNILYRYTGSRWETLSAGISINTNAVPVNTLVPCTLQQNNKSYGPKTLASFVYMDDGKTVKDVISELNTGSHINMALSTLKNTKVISNNVSTVNIGISGYNKNTDILFVYINSTYIHEGEDYNIVNDTIQKTKGTWDGTEEEITFNFVVLKTNTQERVLAGLKNTTVITEDTNTVEIGISGYNKNTDILFVYINSTYIEEGQDYSIVNNSIRKSNGTWTGSEDEITFNFIVFKVNTQSRIFTQEQELYKDQISELTEKVNRYESTITSLTEKITLLEQRLL